MDFEQSAIQVLDSPEDSERVELFEKISTKKRLLLIIQGVPLFILLAISGGIYWLALLWDVKGVRRRTLHFYLKLRNLWQSYFAPKYVKKWEAMRFNDCGHCSACCEILWRCPFLKKDSSGRSTCTVHSNRPLPCRTFPIDYRAAEIISRGRKAENSCTYTFMVQYRLNNISQKLAISKDSDAPKKNSSSQ